MINPFPKYLLVLPIKEEQMTSGGIALPEISQDKPMKGEVVAIGEKIKNVKVGDIIVHKKWINETYKHEGTEYIFVRKEDLLAKL